jgi:ribonucleotide monophosphatase NagD (HAD superfamily)
MRREKQAALKEVELFVLDMDGTIYLGDELIAGAIEFMQKVKLTGRDFILFTNNSSRTADF